MPSTTPLLPGDRACVVALERLQPVGGAHDDVRRYSQVRRNLLPRADHVTAVAGGWAHDAVLAADATIEVALWCPGSRAHPALASAAASVAGRAERAFRISERTLVRIQPGASAPELVSVVRLPRWEHEPWRSASISTLPKITLLQARQRAT